MGVFAIDEEFLQQVEALQILLKNNLAGNAGGNHRSKAFGSSCEYVDFRDYVAGDDVSKIDWNAYARSENLYLKLYSDERQMHTKIYVDASRSMAFGKGGKEVQALRLAATIAYLSVCDMDRVSVYAVRDKQVEEIIYGMHGKEGFLASIGKLNEIEFYGDSFLSEALLPTDPGYGDGLSVIISDFLTDNNYEDAIDYLADKRRDVMCIQVLSQEELNPKARGKVHFFDSENTEKFYRKNINREIAKAYRQALDYATGRIGGYCASRGAEYLLVSAEDSVAQIFFERFVNMGVAK